FLCTHSFTLFPYTTLFRSLEEGFSSLFFMLNLFNRPLKLQVFIHSNFSLISSSRIEEIFFNSLLVSNHSPIRKITAAHKTWYSNGKTTFGGILGSLTDPNDLGKKYKYASIFLILSPSESPSVNKDANVLIFSSKFSSNVIMSISFTNDVSFST